MKIKSFRILLPPRETVGAVFRFSLILNFEALGKIREEYVLETACGANLGALSAAPALFVVYFGKIVYNLNSSLGASLNAFAAGNAGILTYLASLSTLILVAAHINNRRFLRNERDNMLGAGIYAKTSTDATAGINVINTVINADSV